MISMSNYDWDKIFWELRDLYIKDGLKEIFPIKTFYWDTSVKLRTKNCIVYIKKPGKPEEDELYSKVVPMEKNNTPFYVVDFDFNEYEDSYKGSNILFSVSRPEYRYTYTTKAMIDNWLDANKADKKEWIENFETFRIDLKQKNMDLILILNLLHEISHAYVPAIKIDDSDLHGLSKKERSVRYHCKDREKLPDVIACEMFVRHYEKIVDIISSYRN